MPIEWSNFTKQNLAKDTVDSITADKLARDQLRQKENSEYRNANIQGYTAENNAENQKGLLSLQGQQNDIQQQQVNQEGQYKQGMLENMRGELGIRQQSTNIDQQRANTEGDRLNLDMTRDMYDLAIRQQTAKEATDKHQWEMKFTNQSWQDQQAIRQAAETGGIAGMQSAYIKMGMPEKAIAISDAQALYQAHILGNQKSYLDIQDQDEKNKAMRRIGLISSSFAAVSADENPESRNRKVIDMADQLDNLTPGSNGMWGKLARKDPEAAMIGIGNANNSQETSLSKNIQDPLFRAQNIDTIHSYGWGKMNTLYSAANHNKSLSEMSNRDIQSEISQNDKLLSGDTSNGGDSYSKALALQAQYTDPTLVKKNTIAALRAQGNNSDANVLQNQLDQSLKSPGQVEYEKKLGTNIADGLKDLEDKALAKQQNVETVNQMYTLLQGLSKSDQPSEIADFQLKKDKLLETAGFDRNTAPREAIQALASKLAIDSSRNDKRVSPAELEELKQAKPSMKGWDMESISMVRNTMIVDSVRSKQYVDAKKQYLTTHHTDNGFNKVWDLYLSKNPALEGGLSLNQDNLNADISPYIEAGSVFANKVEQ